MKKKSRKKWKTRRKATKKKKYIKTVFILCEVFLQGVLYLYVGTIYVYENNDDCVYRYKD